MAVYIAGVDRAIDTADTYFNEIKKLPIGGAKVAKDKLLERTRINNLPVYDGKPLEARIEYARWIVDCPNCHNAEFAFEDNLFLCSSCKNSDINGQIRKVKMPKERKGIEDLLSKRKIINRHWYPGETVKELVDENILHGLEVI